MSDSKHRLTWKKDPVDQRDYILSLPVTPKTAARVDLRTRCPTIYDQGQLGSCVANGTAFNIQYDQIKNSYSHQFVPSRLFIYYNTRVLEHTVNEDSGTTIRGALVATSQQGACPEVTWPYNISRFTTRPSSAAYSSGAAHMVKVYTRILFDLNQMKQCLISGYPFIFGIYLYTSFYNVSSNGRVPIPGPHESYIGGHCMACVGYDDAIQCFIVRNSWGTSWGDHGYCYLPYSYMTNADTTFDLWSIRTISDTEQTLTKVRKVTYGKGARIIDVTNTFKNYFGSHAQMIVSNSLLTDPCYGVYKELRITLTNGALMVFGEGATVRMTDLVPTSAMIIRVSNISKAMYGKTKYVNVTTILKNQFSQGYPRVAVSNALFGDPCYGVYKELRLTLINGAVRVYGENGSVSINDIII